MAKKSYKLSKNVRDVKRNIGKIPHEIYHRNKEHFEKIEEIFEQLKKAENITEDEILGVFRQKHDLKAIPLSIFSTWLAPLEAIVLYMKDTLNLTYSEIARELNRDQRTIWLTYQNAKKKNIGIVISGNYYIPLDIFKNRALSMLENLSVYLHEVKGHAFREISDMIKKDNRTIWTVYNRAKKKASGGKSTVKNKSSKKGER